MPRHGRMGRALRKNLEVEPLERVDLLPRRSILLSSTRWKLFTRLHETPYPRLCELARYTGLRPSTISYHIKVMAESELLDIYRGVPAPLEYVPAELKEVLNVLSMPLPFAAFREIGAEPGISLGMLGSRIGTTRQWASRVASMLTLCGTVVSVRDGRTVRLYPGESYREAVRTMEERSFKYQKYLLKVLTSDGLSPEVLRSALEYIVVRLRSPRKHTVTICTVPHALQSPPSQKLRLYSTARIYEPEGSDAR